MDEMFLNRLVPIIVIAIGIAMFFTAYLYNYPDFLYFNKNPSTAWGFVLWLIWWATFLVVYSMIPIATVELHPYILSVLDIGDLMLLGFAICYCSGNNQFGIKRLLPLPLVFIAFVLYYFILHNVFRNHPSSTFTIWLFSPSVVVANVSILSLGWSFLVRWGIKAVPFFLVTVAYALAQLPAYLSLFVTRPEQYKNYAQLVSGSKEIFIFLFIGKVILAGYPLVLFLSPEGFRPDMDTAKYWPSTETIKLHPSISKGLLWGLTILASMLLGAVGNTLLSRIGLRP